MKSKRIGEKYKSNEGYEFEIIDTKDNDVVVVKVLNVDYEYIRDVSYKELKRGRVKNHYHRSVYGVGYFGVGIYSSKENGEKSKAYVAWNSMLQRCYDEKYLKKYPSYIGCTVCDEWHNFQNFAKWFYENYYDVNGERMELDKDIMIKGNKVYSPSSCILVPQKINSLLVKNNRTRGSLPIGVCSSGGRYISFCKKPNSSNRGYIGSFSTIEEAFNAYKIKKEFIIKEVAKEYKDLIPVVLYNALMNYKIEITD